MLIIYEKIFEVEPTLLKFRTQRYTPAFPKYTQS